MDGTTGYDALALLDRVLTDPAGEQPLDALEARLRGGHVGLAPAGPRPQARRGRREPAAPRPGGSCASCPTCCPHRHERLEDAVAEVLACFPVYRSYLPARARAPRRGARRCPRRTGPTSPTVLDVPRVRCWPTRRPPAALRFQQTSGMVMAKGVEDCAFYRYSRLTSLNEVGADPSRLRRSRPTEFHDAMAAPPARLAARDDRAVDPRHQARRGRPRPDRRARRGPGALGGDPRPAPAAACPCPTRASATCCGRPPFGAWPIERASGCTRTPRRRCARPASTPPGPTPTRTTRAPCTQRSTRPRRRRGVARGARRAGRAASRRPVASNSLAAQAARADDAGCARRLPGQRGRASVSLVDPDNRRPVDFDAAAATLADGSVDKQRDHRRRRCGCGATGRSCSPSYTPLPAEGPAADHVLAFDRGGAITVVTRLPLGLAAKGGWGDTTLAAAGGCVDERARRGFETLDWRSLLNHRSPTLLRRLPGGAAGAGGLMRGRFDVWAPLPGAGAAERRRRGRRDDQGRRRLVVAGRAGAGRRGRLRLPARRLGPGRCPTRGRGASRAACTSGRAPSTPTAFAWTDDHWTGRQLAGSVVYELHIGTFTPEGTLDAAAERLDHLVDARRRPGRAAAGQRVQRHPQLGVRRRALVGRRTSSTAGRRRTSASSTPPTRPDSA